VRTALFTIVVLGAPRLALACPVCFGQNDSPMAAAANLAIVVMLVIVAGVLAAFASFFLYLRRRAQMADAELGPPASEPAGPEGRRPAEGTAQC
jgi:heme/copper-type cytochrome/quinol oxidase subunit 2